MVVCSVCGNNETAHDAAFCTQCGNLFETAPQPTAPQPTAPQPTAPQPTAPQPTAPQPTAPHLLLPDNSTIQLDEQSKVIGRLELLNSINLVPGTDPMTVSRQHCTIHYDGGKYYLEDDANSVQEKASTNHTYHNGVDITSKGRKELNDGDTIDFSNTVKLIFKK